MTARQAVRWREDRRRRSPSRARSVDHNPSAPISAMPCSSRSPCRARPRRSRRWRWIGEILHARAEPQRDVGTFRAPGSQQRRLQVGAMDHPIGRAVALLGRVAERDAHDVAAARGLDPRSPPARPRAARSRSPRPRREQHARRVGRKLDAGAGLFEPRGLLQHTARNPARASVSAAVSPPIPAPAMMMVRERATAGRPSGQTASVRAQAHLGRLRHGGSSAGSCRYSVEQYGQMNSLSPPMSQKDVRMIERRRGADAHEFAGRRSRSRRRRDRCGNAERCARP